MKKLLSAVLFFIIICSCVLCSCDVISFPKAFSDSNDNSSQEVSENTEVPTESKTQITEIKYDISYYYSPVTLTNGYDNLENNAQREIYNNIFGSVYSIENEKTTDECYYLMADVLYSGEEEITERDMIIAYAAFKNDHPEFFWLDTECVADITNEGSYMYIYSTYSPEETAEKSEEFMSVVEKIILSVPDNLSEYERELYIHDVIYEICEYDDYAAEVVYGDDDYVDYFDSYNAYGTLVNGSAVCQGYADAYTYLLSLVGVNNTQISSQDHIWNAVELDEQWYNVDLTWDDTTGSYDYFNITDEEIAYDHDTAPLYTYMTDEEIVGTENDTGLWFNVYLPECTATQYSYYNHRLY